MAINVPHATALLLARLVDIVRPPAEAKQADAHLRGDRSPGPDRTAERLDAYHGLREREQARPPACSRGSSRSVSATPMDRCQTSTKCTTSRKSCVQCGPHMKLYW